MTGQNGQVYEMQLNNIIEILWRRKWIFVLISLTSILLGWGFSQMVTPRYTSSAQIALGEFDSELYTDPVTARQVIINRDTLEPIMQDLNLNFEDVDEFKNSIHFRSIKKTNVVEIRAVYTDPVIAKQIVSEVIQSFLSQSKKSYTKQRTSKKVYLDILEKQQSELIYNISGGVIKYELEALNNIISEIHDVKKQIDKMSAAEIIEHPSNPENPSFPRTNMNILLSAIGGVLLAFFIICFIEYFSRHPVKFDKK